MSGPYFIRRKLAENMKSVPQGGIKWRPGGEILWNSRQVGSRNMRVGKRIICGIMAGILFMVEPVSGYGMMREGTWKKDIRNQIMEIQQRIRSKMSKRDYIDAGSIQTTVNFDGHIYHIRIAFRRTDSNSEYNIDIESNGVEVIVE